jgi:DNA mismatch repair ATPase MutS
MGRASPLHPAIRTIQSPGGTDKGHGIHVSRLTGMPDEVIERAREVLRDLEATGKAQKPGKVSEKTQKVQLTFFEADVHPVEAVKTDRGETTIFAMDRSDIRRM